MQDKMPLPLRPHHSLCLQNFSGEGYSSAFTLSMARIRDCLMKDPERKVHLTLKCDRICGTCPHRKGDACFSPKPSLYDQNLLSMTGLSPGQILSWKELLALTVPLNRARLRECCPDCQWLPLCLSLQGKT